MAQAAIWSAFALLGALVSYKARRWSLLGVDWGIAQRTALSKPSIAMWQRERWIRAMAWLLRATGLAMAAWGLVKAVKIGPHH